MLKEGDEVEIIGHTGINPFATRNWVGKTGVIKKQPNLMNSVLYNDCYAVYSLQDDDWFWFHKDDLKLREKTMENVQAGDIIFDDDGDEREIFARSGVLLAVQHYNDRHDFTWYHQDELVERGFKAIGDSPPVEMTVEEAAEKLGISNLKIVKG